MSQMSLIVKCTIIVSMVMMYGCAMQQTDKNTDVIAIMNEDSWLEYFKSATITLCIIPHIGQVSDCYSQYKDLMEETNVNSTVDSKVKSYCCSIYGFRSCVVKVISKYCGTKEHVKNVTDSFIDKLNHALRIKCDGYNTFFPCLNNWIKAGLIIMILLVCGALISIIVYCYQKNQ